MRTGEGDEMATFKRVSYRGYGLQVNQVSGRVWLVRSGERRLSWPNMDVAKAYCDKAHEWKDAHYARFGVV